MKKWLKRLIQLIFLLIMVFCLMEIFSYLKKRHDNDKELSRVQSELSDIVPEQISEASIEEGAANPDLVDYKALMAKLKSMNKNAVGYIQILGHEENQYPIMQSDDNEFYLRRGMDDKYYVYGLPFMDCRNYPDLTDQNTIIYAHMMEYGDVMFGVFRHYLDQDYVDKQIKKFTITNENGVYTYHIYSLMHVDADAPYRIPNREKDKYLEDLVANYAKSEYDFGYKSDFTAEDRIATLSTCTTEHNADRRIAIVGILEKVETKDKTILRDDIMKVEGGSWAKALGEEVVEKELE